MKLKTRLIGINLGIILMITAGTFGFLLWNTCSMTKLSTIESINNQAIIVSSEMEAIIDDALSDSRELSSTVAYMKMAGGYDRAVVSELLRAKLESSENYIYAWLAFEPDSFDGRDEMFKGDLGSDNNGRFMPSWGRSGDDLILELCTDVETSDYYSVDRHFIYYCITYYYSK